MFLKFKTTAGSKDFTFQDPDTGFKFTAGNFDALLSHIRSYRAQNDLPEIDFLPQVIENYLCHLPINAGSCKRIPPLKRGIWQTVRGGIALLTNMAYKATVTQEVADSRSEICFNCPNNTTPPGKGFTKWSNDLAIDAVGDKRSKHHDSLGVCAVCSCPLKPKVWYDGKIRLTQEEVTEMEKVSCWQPPLAQITRQNKRVS